MRAKKLIFYVATVILTGIMLFSVFNYFFNNEMIAGFYESMGYPKYLIYPLAIAKILQNGLKSGPMRVFSSIPPWLFLLILW